MVFMFGWFSKKRVDKIEEDTKKSFESVKKDFEGVGKWIKHLDSKDKQLFDLLNILKVDLSSIEGEIESLREAVEMVNYQENYKRLSKKQTAVYKQTAVCGVEKPVQTAVQTADFYDILHGLSSNERLIVFTLLNAGRDMKLSYEDIARLLGKERSTIRGQINAIKQKSESLIKEMTEPNGKKRLYIEEETREKLERYAKVRVKSKKKTRERE